MTAQTDSGASSRFLGWIALGVSGAGVALTVRPVHVTSVVFWVVLGTALAATAVGCVTFLRARGRVRRWRRESQRQLVANECRRIHDALAAFIADALLRQPRPARFAAGAGRVERWREETLARYRRELRPWATRVFDDAVECGGVLPSARALVDAPGPGQLQTLRDLFRDAAARLDDEVPRQP